MTDKQPAACPSEATVKLWREACDAARIPACNKRECKECRAAALVIERAISRPAQDDVEAVAASIRAILRRRIVDGLLVRYTIETAEECAEAALTAMAERDRALREALDAMILEHDAGGITLATMREARAILASTGDAA